MLSPAVERALAEARAAWPDVDVPPEIFASYLAARADGADASKVHAADLYLACACARGDARAIAAFDRVYLAPVEGIVRSVGAEHLAADLAQTVRARLLGDEQGRRRIEDYRGTGTLAGWIRIMSVRLASNARRHERARTRAERTPGALAPPTIEDEVLRARYGDAFNAAFRDAFRALDAEDRLVLRLHFVEAMTFDQIAAALEFSRATVGRRLLGARTRLREETLRALEGSLAATRAEIESVLAALASHLDVSFSALVSAA
jgi:RNA polymerase sigma-70 factor (ECF subfamily)